MPSAIPKDRQPAERKVYKFTSLSPKVGKELNSRHDKAQLAFLSPPHYRRSWLSDQKSSEAGFELVRKEAHKGLRGDLYSSNTLKELSQRTHRELLTLNTEADQSQRKKNAFEHKPKVSLGLLSDFTIPSMTSYVSQAEIK